MKSLAGSCEIPEGSHISDQVADAKNKLGWESHKIRRRHGLNRVDFRFQENFGGNDVIQNRTQCFVG